MNNINQAKIFIERIHPDARMPMIATNLSSGADIYAYINDTDHNDKPVSEYTIYPHTTVKIGTGLRMRPEKGFDIKLLPRSGLAFKHSLTLANAVGLIDNDYSGEICILIHNLSSTKVTIKHNDRIAQMIVQPIYQPEFVVIKSLPEANSDRGDGGFGSTGHN